MFKLYVGNLSWGTENEALRSAFEPFGTVTEATVIRDRESGRSKGYGFVTFETDDAGKSALTAMNGAELDGRKIRCDAAGNKPPRNEGHGGRGPRGEGRGPRGEGRGSRDAGGERRQDGGRAEAHRGGGSRREGGSSGDGGGDW